MPTQRWQGNRTLIGTWLSYMHYSLKMSIRSLELINGVERLWPTRSGLEVSPQRAATSGIVSSCHSYALLLPLGRSMRLTEMYEHSVWRNERAHGPFFIITHNDYELNFGGGEKNVCKSISACSSAGSGNESIRWWMAVIHAFTFYTSC